MAALKGQDTGGGRGDARQMAAAIKAGLNELATPANPPAKDK